MFDDVPTKLWLLLLIAIIAWAPARYVFRHVTRSPYRRDITQPPEDFTWRSSVALTRNVAILVGLVALTAFVLTPTAADLAQSPGFPLVLIAGLGVFTLWSVIRGYTTGVIKPMVRGVSWEFSRAKQPKRYWASIGWNGMLSAVFIFLGVQFLVEAPTQALRDRCHDSKNALAPKVELAACDQLIAENAEGDRSGVIASRGSAYYRLADYRRAGADYATAIRLDPRDGSSYYNLGLLHEQLGDRERAAADYGTAIRIDPKNADAFANRGLIFLDTGRFDQAIGDFTHAHGLQPTNVMALANRGISYAWQNDRVRAERDFSAVRKSDPSNLVLLHGEALLAMTNGDMTNGVRLLDDAIARDPNDTWALATRAKALRHLGDRRK